MANRLRWGVIGTARINAKVLPHFETSSRNTLHGVASRNLLRARVEADRYRIPHAYGSYAELVADPAVEVVYISLPNHLHFEWAKASLEAGKHVLCEKPLTLDVNEAEILVALAKVKKLQLAEGYMYRHHAQSVRILELVRGGTLGEVRGVQGSFHITIAPGANIRTDGRTGGGALADVGCYLVNFANAIIGRAPEHVFARGRIQGTTPAENYDTLFSALLDYGNGVSAQLDGGFLGPRIDELRILGEKGWLEIPHPFKPTEIENLRLFRRPTRESPVTLETIEVKDVDDPYRSEIENFGALIEGVGKFPIAAWETFAGVSTLSNIYTGLRA
jgi:xylose dehydrogenase (NAD/NADP)